MRACQHNTWCREVLSMPANLLALFKRGKESKLYRKGQSEKSVVPLRTRGLVNQLLHLQIDSPTFHGSFFACPKLPPELIMSEALDEGKKAKRKLDNS